MQERREREVVVIAKMGSMEAGDVRQVVGHLKLMDMLDVLTVAEGCGCRG